MSSSEQQAAAVVIGLREVYDQLVRLTSEVATLGGRVDRLADRSSAADERLTDHVAADARRLDDHESRLRQVERRGWVLAGAAAVVGVGGGYLATLIGGAV